MKRVHFTHTSSIHDKSHIAKCDSIVNDSIVTFYRYSCEIGSKLG